MTPPLLVKTYHLSTFSIILSSFIYNQLYVKDEHGGGLLDYKGFGGKFKYLTLDQCQVLEFSSKAFVI
jgi:hypothetical protein